jgi:hypothetical protein
MGTHRRRIRLQPDLFWPPPEHPDWPTLPQEVQLRLRQLLTQLLLAAHDCHHASRQRREVRDE